MSWKLLQLFQNSGSYWTFILLGINNVLASPAQATESPFLNFEPPQNFASFPSRLDGSTSFPVSAGEKVNTSSPISVSLLPLALNSDKAQVEVPVSDGGSASSQAVRSFRLQRMSIHMRDRPLKSLFEGETFSLVAKAVGAAEGTRTPEGQRTWAYQGHRDPGNGVWNLGTFSYQHGAISPEAADRKQLQRLERQAQLLRQQAVAQGLELTLLEELNGIDLANQSPRAALDRGYIKRLKEARERGLTGADAVIWARTHAYRDPKTGRWNAPGLGNTAASIRRDQSRRFVAVKQAIANHPVENPPKSPRQAIVLSNQVQLFEHPEVIATASSQSSTLIPEAMAEKIVSVDLSIE
ncbi:MAG: hypothetical protein SFW36_17200 [Leptolyngbyaceae cyanobacterium bins.59]|nr:hypothetical protein [Leptolyngbyaceae cyanobacterium bins.59]